MNSLRSSDVGSSRQLERAIALRGELDRAFRSELLDHRFEHHLFGKGGCEHNPGVWPSARVAVGINAPSCLQRLAARVSLAPTAAEPILGGELAHAGACGGCLPATIVTAASSISRSALHRVSWRHSPCWVWATRAVEICPGFTGLPCRRSPWSVSPTPQSEEIPRFITVIRSIGAEAGCPSHVPANAGSCPPSRGGCPPTLIVTRARAVLEAGGLLALGCGG